jgi:hypothetical protein
MRCPTCGKSAREIEDPQVEDLQFESEERIGGTLCAKAACKTCGVFSATLAIDIEVQVPVAQRQIDHELEIDLEPGFGSLATTGFPASIRCSFGKLKAQGVVMLRRGQ